MDYIRKDLETDRCPTTNDLANAHLDQFKNRLSNKSPCTYVVSD